VFRKSLRARPQKKKSAEVARRPHWFAVLLVAGALIAYANSFATPFVYDDQGTIVDNPNIRQLWPLATALTGPRQSPLGGRPIVSLSFAINHAAGGSSPLGYHAGNLGIHVLAGLLLFGIVRRTLTTPALAARFATAADPLAFACALIWLVHPLQTEVIDYLTQRTESMMGLFYLLTLYAAIRAISSGPGRAWPWEAIAIAACTLGMASKESMVTAPLMVLAYDAVFQAGSPRSALRARARLYSGLAATWVILAALNLSGPRSHSAGFSSGVTAWTYLLNQPAMIVRYLKLSFWPRGLVLDYGPPRAVSLSEALPSAAVVLVLLALTAAAWRKRRELAFLGTWFFVTLAPSSTVIPIATEAGAERRMYLPLAAIVVALVIGGWALLESIPRLFPRLSTSARRRAWLMAVCVMGVSCALTALTLQRNGEYSSRTGIWQTVLDRRPHGRAHYNLAIELKAQGKRAEALQHYQAALADTPDAHYALGFELDADRQYDEAIKHYREYIRLRPDDINVIRAYALLGRALSMQGQLDAAAEAFRQVLLMQPRHADARGGLADVLLRQERYDDAIREYREYLRLEPGNAAAHSQLGIALVGRDMEQEAVQEFTRASELKPEDPATRLNLANALASVGRLDEAVIEYRRGLAIAPTHVALHNALATVLAAQGKVEEALALFRRSLELDPTNEQTRVDFAAAFPRAGTDAGAGKR
jgi:protein O-mannosyl-transferase